MPIESDGVFMCTEIFVRALRPRRPGGQGRGRVPAAQGRRVDVSSSRRSSRRPSARWCRFWWRTRRRLKGLSNPTAGSVVVLGAEQVAVGGEGAEVDARRRRRAEQDEEVGRQVAGVVLRRRASKASRAAPSSAMRSSSPVVDADLVEQLLAGLLVVDREEHLLEVVEGALLLAELGAQAGGQGAEVLGRVRACASPAR